MQSIELDFSAPPTRIKPTGAVFLLIGIVLTFSIAFDIVEILSQRDNTNEKLAQLSARAAELRTTKGPLVRTGKRTSWAANAGRETVPDDGEARRIVEAQKVIRALGAPWNDMFDALEKAQDDTVALLTISPEIASGRLAITGETKNYEALTAYLARLDDSGGLMHAQLLAHEVKGGERNVVFSATASIRK